VEANGIPHAPLEARRSLRVGLVRDIFDTVTRSKECFLNNFQLPASHIEPLFNTRHLAGFVLEDGSQRPAEDPQVQAQALVAEVEELVLQLLEGVDIARSVVVVDLCPARDAWTDEMSQFVEGMVLASSST